MTGNPFTVKVKKGAAKGQSYQVKSEAMVMGSDPDVDIVITEEGVEPRHAQVVFQGGQVILEDLGTQTGTFRNGKRLLGPVRIFPGDRIGLGPRVVLILEGDDPNQGAKEGGLSGAVGKAIDDLAGDLGLGPEGAEEPGEAA